METGYIKITEDDKHEYRVEAKLIQGELWLSSWEIASLFNVFTKTIDGTLKSIFNAGLLRESEVTHIYSFTKDNGQKCFATLYNFEALTFIGFRIATFEAKAFQEWVLKGFLENLKNDNRISNVMQFIVLNKESNYSNMMAN